MMSNRVARSGVGLLALIVALQVTLGPALAQEEAKSAATLKVGDKAPPLKIEKWLKNGPVNGFEKDKIYVVEFWATWCGPCIASMPHLSAVQKAYKDKGVTVIGTNIWEARGKAEYTDATLTKVQDFVKEQGDRMNYTVAYDGKSKAMDTSYMKAAGEGGIPCTFVVDKTGTIAWIGHPMWVEVPLDAIVAGKWDPKTGPAEVAKGEKQLSKVEEKMRTAPKEALAAWEAFERDYPSVAHGLTDTKFSVLLAGGAYDKAYKLAAEMIDAAIAAKDGNALNSIAWAIVDPDAKVEKKDLDLALKAALKADELTKHEEPSIIDTLARVYFVKGDVAKAIEVQAKAVELAKGPMKAELQKTLDEYKKK